MHKIYEYKGNYGLIYRINQIIYSNVISITIEKLVKFLSLSEKDILSIKKDKSKDLNIKYNKTIKCLKIKYIIFYNLAFFFLFIFWYYISCFCAVFINTQIFLIKDTLISFGLSLVYPLLLNLLPGAFRIPSLKSKNKKKEILYKISIFIQYI